MHSFVANPYFFANITNQTFVSTTFGKLFVTNYVAATVLGFFSLPLALLMIVYKSPKSIEDFRRILLITTMLDSFLWVVYAFGQIRSRIKDGVGLYAYIGPISFLSFEAHCIYVIVYSAAITFSCLMVPLPFWYRSQLLNSDIPSNKSLCCYFAIALSFLIVDTSSFVIDLLTTDYLDDYSAFWYEEVPIPMLFVFDTIGSKLVFYGTIFCMIEIIGVFLITFFIAWRSYRSLKCQNSGLSRPSRYMDQFSRLLFVQLFIPLTFIFLPMISDCVSLFYDISNELVQQATYVVLTWVPFINSTSTLILIVSYRRAILSKVRGHVCPNSTTLFVHTFSSTQTRQK